MFSSIKNFFYADEIIVTDFTQCPDEKHFDELRDLMAPTIAGGNVIHGELTSVEYKKISIPKKWIQEINAVAKELNLRATKNGEIFDRFKKDEGHIPVFYAVSIKNTLSPCSPAYPARVEEKYSRIGRITKGTVRSVVRSYKAYFDAMDKDLLNALASLNQAYINFKSSIDGEKSRYTPVDPLENLMAERIIKEAGSPVSVWNTLDMYLDRFKTENMYDLNKFEMEEYEAAEKYINDYHNYFNYQEYMKEFNLLCYCVSTYFGKRSGIESYGEQYLESLFDEFGLPHKLDKIPFM